MVIIPELYPHQVAMRDDLRAAIAKHRRVILCAPPGTGKTRLAKAILGSFANRQKKDGESGHAMFAVHRRGLVDNASDSFSEPPELPHGVIMSGRETNGGCSIQVASIDTKLSWFCESGQYANSFTYDLLILDECVTGDAIVDTELGPMRLDEIPYRKPSMVHSYSKEEGEYFSKILNWAHKGKRDTIEVHTHNSKLRVTPDHEIFTRRGWLQAKDLLTTDEILACADADSNCLRPTFLRGTGIRNVSRRANGRRRSRMSTVMRRSAFAGAGRSQGLQPRTGRSGADFEGCMRRIMRTDTQTATAIKHCNSRRLKGKRYLGRYSEIRQSATRIRIPGRHGYPVHTDWFRKNGLSIRLSSCTDSVPVSALQSTPDGEMSQLSLQQHAIHRSSISTTRLSNGKKSEYQKSGLTGSAISGSRGGCATMVLQEGSTCSCTQKDSPKKRTSLLQTGFAITSEKHLSAATMLRTPISSASQVGPKSRLAGELNSMSQSVCGTSWSRVVSIVPAEPTDVYDIEVEGSHCFFANNLLVHNCHAHVQKFRTFMDAHDAKRTELGLKPAFVLGLSATPQHKELNKLFSVIVKGPSPQWLIDNGYLSPFRYFRCTQGQLDKLVKRGDEYTADSVSAAMEGLAGNLVKDWKRLAEGRATVGFFPRRSHAQEAVELLRAGGIDAHYVDGETPDDERRKVFKWLNEGDIDYICNVGVIERGTDIPRIGCVQLCTAIGSVVRYKQMVGRGSRVHPDVLDCIVLDHAANIKNHGFFEDDVEWTLEWGERPSKTHDAIPTVNCPRCDAVYRGGKCRACGYEPTPKERKSQGLEFVGGELKEVTQRTKDASAKKSNEALMVQALYIASKRNGSFGSAWKIATTMAERQGTRFQVPATFVVAGQRYRTIPHGNQDARRKVRDTYGFTQKNYGRDDNPYWIGSE